MAHPVRLQPAYPLLHMIDLGSIAGLYERGYELHAYCHHCGHWRVLDLGAMVRRGIGARRLPLTVRCLRCGDVGTLQVRPPTSDWTGVLSTWGGHNPTLTRSGDHPSA